MKNLPTPEIWFITGSQHLYGEGPLRQVAVNSQKIVDELNATKRLPLKLVFKPILTRPEEIRALCLEANSSSNCAGLIIWCHTFSPSKMWINGLLQLRKPGAAPRHASSSTWFSYRSVFCAGGAAWAR